MVDLIGALSHPCREARRLLELAKTGSPGLNGSHAHGRPSRPLGSREHMRLPNRFDEYQADAEFGGSAPSRRGRSGRTAWSLWRREDRGSLSATFMILCWLMTTSA